MLAPLATFEDCRARMADAWSFMQELYPLCRSITGSGTRATLDAIGARIPLQRFEVATGTQVFDWEVPKEWNVREAWIENSKGERIVDLRNHTLHLMSYSTPVDAVMSLEELQPHLHSMPEHPDWIPYRTSYYRDNWGFCLPHRQRAELREDQYRVRIDSDLRPGNLTYGEFYQRGKTEEEVLLFTHICHPSLCNDNLTGIALATELATQLQRSSPQFSYRIVFAPGTIGSITWLANNESRVGRVRHGLVLGLLGDRGPLTYKRSRRGKADIDQIAEYVLDGIGAGARLVDFSPYGYDERQLCSPGFNLPVGRLTRTPNNEYPEYHSSADNFSILDQDSMAQSLQAAAGILRIADRNAVYVNLSPKCEPRLGKRGLFSLTGGRHPGEFEHALLWVLNQSDGTNDLLAIARRARLPFDLIAGAADALAGVQLLRREDSGIGSGQAS
jgi:aminopeptidase-like protein